MKNLDEIRNDLLSKSLENAVKILEIFKPDADKNAIEFKEKLINEKGLK